MDDDRRAAGLATAGPKGARAYLRLYLSGCAMGAADLVPGVSGGTMAFVLGIYEQLLAAIRAFDLGALRLALRFRLRELRAQLPLPFLLTLYAGMLTSVFGLSAFLSTTLDDAGGRILLFAFFFGLVLASILAIGTQLQRPARALPALISGALVAFAIVNLTPAEAEPTALNLFLAGMVAICAMILPGISGSFILLLLGQYDHLLRALGARNLEVPLIVAAGAALGIVLFSRVLGWLLRHHRQRTIAVLVGVMVGSLWKIWPWKECVASDLDRHGNFRCLQEANLAPQAENLAPALALMLAGFLLVSAVDHLQSRANPLLRLFTDRR